MEKEPTLRPVKEPLRLRAECTNYVGLKRKSNQDSLCMNDYWLAPEHMGDNVACTQELSLMVGVYGVFDGVGGDAHGDLAACAAARFFSRGGALLARAAESQEQANALFLEANGAVWAQGEGSGTTATLLTISHASAWVLNVGDSGAYLMRNGQLERLSTTHRLDGPGSHVITRCLGQAGENASCSPSRSRRIPLIYDDLFLLCSDGLTDMVPEERIGDILSDSAMSDRQKADELVSQAMAAGGRDNTTVILLRVLPEE